MGEHCQPNKASLASLPCFTTVPSLAWRTRLLCFAWTTTSKTQHHQIAQASCPFRRTGPAARGTLVLRISTAFWAPMAGATLRSPRDPASAIWYGPLVPSLCTALFSNGARSRTTLTAHRFQEGHLGKNCELVLEHVCANQCNGESGVLLQTLQQIGLRGVL